MMLINHYSVVKYIVSTQWSFQIFISNFGGTIQKNLHKYILIEQSVIQYTLIEQVYANMQIYFNRTVNITVCQI